MLQFKPGSDVALLNAIMHVIVEEGLYDVQYLQAYTEDFERLRSIVASYQPGVDGRHLRHRRRDHSRRSRAPSDAPNAP